MGGVGGFNLRIYFSSSVCFPIKRWFQMSFPSYSPSPLPFIHALLFLPYPIFSNFCILYIVYRLLSQPFSYFLKSSFFLSVSSPIFIFIFHLFNSPFSLIYRRLTINPPLFLSPIVLLNIVFSLPYRPRVMHTFDEIKAADRYFPKMSSEEQVQATIICGLGTGMSVNEVVSHFSLPKF
jgi:hypothetical protein